MKMWLIFKKYNHDRKKPHHENKKWGLGRKVAAILRKSTIKKKSLHYLKKVVPDHKNPLIFLKNKQFQS